MNANKSSNSIVRIIAIIMTDRTISFLVSGLRPTASATLEPSIPNPIPIPRNAMPSIIPIAVMVVDKMFSISNLLLFLMSSLFQLSFSKFVHLYFLFCFPKSLSTRTTFCGCLDNKDVRKNNLYTIKFNISKHNA